MSNGSLSSPSDTILSVEIFSENWISKSFMKLLKRNWSRTFKFKKENWKTPFHVQLRALYPIHQIHLKPYGEDFTLWLKHWQEQRPKMQVRGELREENKKARYWVHWVTYHLSLSRRDDRRCNREGWDAYELWRWSSSNEACLWGNEVHKILKPSARIKTKNWSESIWVNDEARVTCKLHRLDQKSRTHVNKKHKNGEDKMTRRQKMARRSGREGLHEAYVAKWGRRLLTTDQFYNSMMLVASLPRW